MEGSGGDWCFLCTTPGPQLQVPVPWRAGEGKGEGEQLSVIFLLRKVLKLPTGILEGILEKCGGKNPGEWGIKLCRVCQVVFKETSFVYRRLLRVRGEWEELVREMRQLVHRTREQNSGEPAPGEGIKRKGRARRGRPLSKQDENGSGGGGVVERLRRAVLENYDLHAEEEEPPPPKILYRCPETRLNTTHPVEVRVVVASQSPTPEGSPSMPKLVRVTPSSRANPGDSIGIVEKLVKTEPSDPLEELQLSDNFDIDLPSPLEFPGDDDPLSPNPPADPEKPESAPEDNNNDSDSDYHPSPPPPKKKDRRFTRAKPNIKENNRRKHLRALKAQSFKNVAHLPPPLPHQQENGAFPCADTSCALQFSRQYLSHVHYLSVHMGDPLPHHCHICDNKRFERETGYRRHMARFHNHTPSPFDPQYKSELHSAETLRSSVAEDAHMKSLLNVTPHQVEGEGEQMVGIPPEILEKFKPGPQKIHVCRQEHCKRRFNNEMMRDAHELRKHQGIPACFSCFHCPKRYIRRAKLLEHLAVAHYSNHPSCPQCGARFADKVLLAGHIGRAHLGDNTLFHCHLCPQQFIRRTKLEQHLHRRHGLPLPRQGSPRVKVPAKHIPVPKLQPSKAKQLPEGETLEPVVRKCWICHTPEGQPLLFATKEDIQEHLDTVHPPPVGDAQARFPCPVSGCPKTYKTNGHLDTHVCNVHGGQITSQDGGGASAEEGQGSRWMCQVCAKVYRTKQYLQDHQRQMHYEELNLQPWKCVHCGKIVGTQKVLDHHVKTVHTKTTPFKCRVPGCSFGSMYPSALRTHTAIRHSGEKKGAICPVCSRTFAAPFYLNRHMRVHTGEKPYKCHVCEKTFSDLPTFQRHKEAHLGRVHKCPVGNCGKEYNTRHAWRTHLKQHQQRGVNVEIPWVRYQPPELDVPLPEEMVAAKAELGELGEGDMGEMETQDLNLI